MPDYDTSGTTKVLGIHKNTYHGQSYSGQCDVGSLECILRVQAMLAESFGTVTHVHTLLLGTAATSKRTFTVSVTFTQVRTICCAFVHHSTTLGVPFFPSHCNWSTLHLLQPCKTQLQENYNKNTSSTSPYCLFNSALCTILWTPCWSHEEPSCTAIFHTWLRRHLSFACGHGMALEYPPLLAFFAILLLQYETTSTSTPRVMTVMYRAQSGPPWIWKLGDKGFLAEQLSWCRTLDAIDFF